MEKITKSEAKKLYDSGKIIFLHPSKMNINSPWMKPMKASKKVDSQEFESLVNSFSYYNCNAQTGKVVSFYKN